MSRHKPMSEWTDEQRRMHNESCQRYRDAHRDKINEIARRCFKKNRDTIIKKQRERNKEKLAYMKANDPEKYQQYLQKQREYRLKKYGPPKPKPIPKTIEERRHVQRQWKRNNPDMVREQKLRRRAIERGTRVENISLIEIYKRDNWICQICHKKIDKELKYPDPMSKSIDHIIPLSCGGTHTIDNLQQAHLCCNVNLKCGGKKQLKLF